MAKKKTTKKSSTGANPATQKELVISVILALFLGLGGGYVIGAVVNSNDETSTKDSSSQAHSHSKTYEVPAENAPSVELMVMEDAKSGYNVRIMTENFTFTPENVNQENVPGEGHAHLYVDGEKVGRVYGEWIHYGGSFEGTKEFKVTLNTNDHADYTVNGEKISDSVKVTHDSDAEGHDEMHDSSGHMHTDM